MFQEMQTKKVGYSLITDLNVNFHQTGYKHHDVSLLQPNWNYL